MTGGDYELIDHITFEPNPDYWILYMWKQLIGDKLCYFTLMAFGFSLKNDENSIVLAAINMFIGKSQIGKFMTNAAMPIPALTPLRDFATRKNHIPSLKYVVWPGIENTAFSLLLLLLLLLLPLHQLQQQNVKQIAKTF